MVLPAVLTCLGRQDAEPLAVVAAVGVAIEMGWAVLAVTSGGGWAAARDGQGVDSVRDGVLLVHLGG